MRGHRQSQAGSLPTKIDADGGIRVYDPTTNTFGAYNPGGSTRTLFKPSSPTYFDRQPGNIAIVTILSLLLDLIVVEISMKNRDFPCPCCGYLAFTAPPGSEEICCVCGWQDDISQLRFPFNGGGANESSLVAAQKTFFDLGYSRDRRLGGLDANQRKGNETLPGE
jgi:hypothetical protein